LVDDESEEVFSPQCSVQCSNYKKNNRVSIPLKDAISTAISLVSSEWIITPMRTVVVLKLAVTVGQLHSGSNVNMVAGQYMIVRTASYIISNSWFASLQGATMSSSE
jgi:hypothetical protein